MSALDSLTFLCDATQCRERHTEIVWQENRLAAYLSLVEAGWQVDRPPVGSWKIYCPEHHNGGVS